MPKKDIPVSQSTLERISTASVETLFARLDEDLAAAEAAAARVAQIKENSRTPPKKLAEHGREVPHLKTLIAKLQDPDVDLQAVASYQEAALLAKEGLEVSKVERRKRDLALLVLHSRHKVLKVTLYTRYDIGRGKLNTAFNSLNGSPPELKEETAWRKADTHHAAYSAALAMESTARAERDARYRQMESGEYGAVFTPADCGRISRLSSARISQIRTGSSNAARALRAAKRRKLAAEEAALAKSESVAV